jgi:beta-exotoxin I transport system permease protein
MDLNLKDIIRFRIVYQTVIDHWKTTIIITALFGAMAALYSSIYPSFKDMMPDFIDGFSDSMSWLPGIEEMGSYVGYLNVELYQIFWMLILGMIIGFIAASIISKEIESKTIDILMSNPVSRAQIIIEKFLGLIPGFLMINFVTMFVIMGVSIGIGEEVNFYFVFLTHLASIPYFLAIISLGILISTLIDEKMKSSLIMMSLVFVLYIFQSIAQMIPDFESLGYISLTHYFNTFDILKDGKIDAVGMMVLLLISVAALLLSMFYFEHKEIKV